MKKNLLTVFTILLITYGSISAQSTTVAEVNPSQSYLIKQLDNLRFKVLFSENLKGKISLKIVDEAGNTLVSESINVGKSIAKLYDMSNLLDGKYTFVFGINKNIESQSVLIKTQINRSALLAMN